MSLAQSHALSLTTYSLFCSHQASVPQTGAPPEPTSDSSPLVIFFVKVLFVDGRRYEFKNCLPIKIYKEDGLWVAEYDELNLHAYGPTLPEAMTMLDERFDVVYQRIIRAEDSTLTPKMRQVRDLMRDVVESAT